MYKKLHMTRLITLRFIICIGRVWSRDHFIAYLTYLVYQFIEWENSLTPGSTLVIPVFVRTSTVSPSFNPTGCEAALKLTKIGTKRYVVWMPRPNANEWNATDFCVWGLEIWGETCVLEFWAIVFCHWRLIPRSRCFCSSWLPLCNEYIKIEINLCGDGMVFPFPSTFEKFLSIYQEKNSFRLLKQSFNHALISIKVLLIKQRTYVKTANNFDACHPIHIHI